MQIKGLDKLNRQLADIGKINTKKPLMAGALVLQRYSMENAPVDTGFLKSSHGSYLTDKGAEMRVSAEYAFFVEFGTSKMAAKPYVRPAIDEHTGDVVKAVGKAVKKEIEGKA